jgi:prephenate dehydrogenase
VEVTLLGLGQIGGSVAHAALTAGFAARVRAWTPSGRGPAVAESHGIEAAASLETAVRGADLIVLAAPPLACLDLLDQLAAGAGGPLGEAVVTDVASTKAEIVERADRLGLRFVGGHPMAGRETSGYDSADGGLFRDRPWIVTPGSGSDAEAIARVEALAGACGARPVRMVASVHDVAVALISHGPLVVSAALAEAAVSRPEWPVARALAAGGWAGMTRLARGDPEMGAGILATNRAAAAGVLRAFRHEIDAWIELLEGDAEAPALHARLAAARDAATEG